MTAIVIGTRVYTRLYNRGYGTVFAIDGEQAPGSVGTIGGVVAFGGRATFDIVFDCGSYSKALPECILRGAQWEVLADVVDAGTIAAAIVYADAEQARARSDADEAKVAYAAEVDRLRSDPRFATLLQGDDTGSGKLAAKNIRLQLRAAFPGIKFSVRNRDYASIDVSWSDGPTNAQVTAVTAAYQAGRFDGMEDIYQSATLPWNIVFGGAKYVFTSRETSPALIERAIATVFEQYAGNFADSGIVATADDYRAGKLFAVTIPLLGDRLETAVRSAASELVG